jgi:hypothetical protein
MRLVGNSQRHRLQNWHQNGEKSGQIQLFHKTPHRLPEIRLEVFLLNHVDTAAEAVLVYDIGREAAVRIGDVEHLPRVLQREELVAKLLRQVLDLRFQLADLRLGEEAVQRAASPAVVGMVD